MKITISTAILAVASAQFNDDAYYALSAPEKQEKIWSYVTKNETSYGWYSNA